MLTIPTTQFYTITSRKHQAMIKFQPLPNSSPNYEDFLIIHHEVDGKAVAHEATALQHIEFQIKSPSLFGGHKPIQICGKPRSMH